MTNRLKQETKLLSMNTWLKKDSVKIEIETMERRVKAMYQRFQANLLYSPFIWLSNTPVKDKHSCKCP
jgi:hypothetical protein